MQDVGLKQRVRVHTDSLAALGVASWRGLGRLRDVNTRGLLGCKTASRLRMSVWPKCQQKKWLTR
eukprot:1475476-Amphidinium_carterae.1